MVSTSSSACGSSLLSSSPTSWCQRHVVCPLRRSGFLPHVLNGSLILLYAVLSAHCPVTLCKHSKNLNCLQGGRCCNISQGIAAWCRTVQHVTMCSDALFVAICSVQTLYGLTKSGGTSHTQAVSFHKMRSSLRCSASV